MSIPIDPQGYSVNVETGVIHTRYATHALGTRTRTAKGVMTLLDGKKGQACKVCYPSPQYPPTPKTLPPQVRRSSPA